IMLRPTMQAVLNVAKTQEVRRRFVMRATVEITLGHITNHYLWIDASKLALDEQEIVATTTGKVQFRCPEIRAKQFIEQIFVNLSASLARTYQNGLIGNRILLRQNSLEMKLH